MQVFRNIAHMDFCFGVRRFGCRNKKFPANAISEYHKWFKSPSKEKFSTKGLNDTEIKQRIIEIFPSQPTLEVLL